MLCWDCCQSQQKKGTLGPLEAARPLPEGAGGGDGASPFLFKPVDGDGVHGGKHVMRTRRNKEVRKVSFDSTKICLSGTATTLFNYQ